MTDDDLRAELQRAYHIEPPSGFVSRTQRQGFGAWMEHRTLSLRAVALGTVGVLLVAGVSARLVSLHWRATSNPLAVAHTHSPAEAGGVPTGAAPSANVTLPAIAVPSTSPAGSAAASATPAPTPECQATDVAVRVATSAPKYTVGQTVYFTASFTNIASHVCGLPPCSEAYSVTDQSGHVVAASRCSLAPAGAAPTVLSPGASTTIGPVELATGGRMGPGPGTYTVYDRWGYCSGTTTFALVAESSPPATASASPSATATPLLP